MSDKPKQIVVYPRGQLVSKDRERLTKAGFVVVEADDPRAVVTMVPGAPLVSSNDMLMAALEAMRGQWSGREEVRARFTGFLHDRMKVNESAAASPSGGKDAPESTDATP